MRLCFRKLDQEVVEKAVKTALQCGYRHIDCASDYENETFVGNALKYGIERMGIKREDLWITSKLWYAPKKMAADLMFQER